MKKAKLLEKQVQEAWDAVKGAYHKKYHAQLRSTLLKIIAKEDDTYPEFVSLMSASGWDPVAEIFRKMESKAAGGVGWYKNVNKALAEEAAAKEQPDVAIIQCKGCGQFTEATNAKNFSDGVFCDKCVDANNAGPLTHQCHYCGDMYTIADLTGAKEGLICYKCRHEMENRE
jgi:formylmethanofuran dehydrogenase subunit E